MIDCNHRVYLSRPTGSVLERCKLHIGHIGEPHLSESGHCWPNDLDPALDLVNHPAHYKSTSGIESIDVIESFGLGFCLGNVVKYILRHEKKGNALEDLKKASWYLDRHIASLEAKP